MYQGWTNRATWNVAHTIRTTEELLRAMRQARVVLSQLYADGPFTPASAESFVRSLWPKGVTPDGELLADVNWVEIAEDFNK